MKKFSKLFMMLAVAFVALLNVKATDLSEKVSILDDNYVKITDKKYDKDNDITEVTFEATADENFINAVFNHMPGTGALYATYNFGVNPGLEGSSFKKYNYSSNESVLDAKKLVEENIENEENSNYSTVWNALVYVVSIKDGKSEYVTYKFDGKTPIKNVLKEKLEVSSDDELVYGKNYYFMTIRNYNVWGWSYESKKDYISSVYKLNYPIYGDYTTSGIYFPTLKSALNFKSPKVVVNEDVEIKEDLTVDERTTLVINKPLTISNGKTLTINGKVKASNGVVIKLEEGATLSLNDESQLDLGEGAKIANSEGDTLYIINKEAINGDVSTDLDYAKEGQKVKVTTKANDGYELKTLKLINLTTNKEEVLKDSEFSMPNSNVKLVAEFAKVTDASENPNTYDGISKYLVLVLISLIGLTSTILVLKKRSLN